MSRTLVLYRAAESDGPYFGRGSYWSPRLDFVESFLVWAEQTWAAKPLRVYRLEVQVGDDDVFDFWEETHVPILSEQLTDARLDAFTAHGFKWVTFMEAPWHGRPGVLTRQYVYLGTEPLPAGDDDG